MLLCQNDCPTDMLCDYLPDWLTKNQCTSSYIFITHCHKRMFCTLHKTSWCHYVMSSCDVIVRFTSWQVSFRKRMVPSGRCKIMKINIKWLDRWQIYSAVAKIGNALLGGGGGWGGWCKSFHIHMCSGCLVVPGE